MKLSLAFDLYTNEDGNELTVSVGQDSYHLRLIGEFQLTKKDRIELERSLQFLSRYVTLLLEEKLERDRDLVV